MGDQLSIERPNVLVAMVGAGQNLRIAILGCENNKGLAACVEIPAAKEAPTGIVDLHARLGYQGYHSLAMRELCVLLHPACGPVCGGRKLNRSSSDQPKGAKSLESNDTQGCAGDG